MERVKGSNLLTIRSRDLKNSSDGGSSGFFTLFESININKGEVMTAKLVSATFPNSWYNLSSTSGNNKLDFKETGDSSYKTITISDGSYNIDELMSSVKALLEANSTNTLTYTLTYDDITNQLTIKNSNPTAKTTTFDFTADNSCRRFLGFTESTQTINSTNGIVSDRAVDITDTQNSIYVRTNLANSKVVESNNGKYSNILAHIPVPLSRNSFFVYEPNNPFEMELSQKSISQIKIFITFQNETDKVYFNNGDWEINIEIAFYKTYDTHRKYHHKDIHKDIEKKYENYRRKQIDDLRDIQEIQKVLRKKNISK